MTREGVTVYYDRIQEIVDASIQAMRKREGLFAFVDPRPEKPFVDLVKTKGPEFALNAVFLITPMVIATRTEPFFRRISAPEDFEEYSWLFEPAEVARKRPSTVEEACFKYLKPAGRQSASIYQWHYNCKRLTRDYGGYVSNFLKDRDNDAMRVYDSLVVRPRAKSYEKEIRRFGPKISKLFIQWLRVYDLYDLSRSDEVGVPVDFQLARVVIQTNGMFLEQPVNAHFITHEVLPLIFKDLVEKGYRPEEISEALWAIGSGGCAYGLHNQCPLENRCTNLISSFAYDRRGIFDPTDVGRYTYSKKRNRP